MTDPSAEKTPQRRTNYRQLFSFAVCCAMICWLIEYPIRPVFAATNQNTLLIGEQALTRDAYAVPVTPPAPMNGMSVEEILRLRVKSIWQQPLLIGINYRPAEAVFCRLHSRASWHNLPGSDLSTGSEYVLNPYLLVAAEVERGRESGLGEFLPTRLTWAPAECQATAVYDVTAYLDRAGRTADRPLTEDDVSLRLVAFNARDLNLNYAAVLSEEAQGVSLPPGLAEPVLLEQYLRYAPHCGEPGGCNEVSLPPAALTGLGWESLPAEFTVRLWTKRPEAATTAPDMRFTLKFR